MNTIESTKTSLVTAILRGKCPRCRKGNISKGFLGLVRQCPTCEYVIHQENGYFLGAMMVGFLLTSILTIPPVIYLKVSGASDEWIILYPLLQYLVLGPILTYYSKLIWAHSGYLFAETIGKDETKLSENAKILTDSELGKFRRFRTPPKY